MKCIKRGTLPENRIWKGECHNCHSVYEALEGELVDIDGNVGVSVLRLSGRD